MYNGDVPWPQQDGSIKMGPNKVWYDEFELTNYYHGRSAVNFTFTSKLTGFDYPMSLSLFYGLIKNNEIHNAKVTGHFTFYKQGTAYLIEKVE